LEKIKNKLDDFSPVGLKDMDNAQLMNRVDTKYVFGLPELPVFLEQLKNDYLVLDVNGNRISRYESLYFDTQNFDLYLNHHRGKPSRFKVRFRKYLESSQDYFEVKVKSNKGRTIKSRIRQTQSETIRDKAEELLKTKTSLFPEQLEAKLWVNYSRITLVNKKSPERVTIDIGLTFKNNRQCKTINNLVIAEVKQEKFFASPFVKLMKSGHIRQGSISKYCFGVITLFHIKHNNFKHALIKINKLLHPYNDIIAGI
jgi:hypothetical protein